MLTKNLNGITRDRLQLWILVAGCCFFLSCSVQPKIPAVIDDPVEEMLRREAGHILTVSEDRGDVSRYHFLLADFPREDILGMSVGKGRIYISYKLASLALTNAGYRWLLRQTVAHEVGHEAAGHAQQEGATWLNRRTFGLGASGGDLGLPWYVRFYNYSVERELEADLKGLGYWNKLGWDCRIWVRILEKFQEQNYTGDSFHPTRKRLQQAQSFCDHPMYPATYSTGPDRRATVCC